MNNIASRTMIHNPLNPVCYKTQYVYAGIIRLFLSLFCGFIVPCAAPPPQAKTEERQNHRRIDGKRERMVEYGLKSMGRRKLPWNILRPWTPVIFARAPKRAAAANARPPASLPARPAAVLPISSARTKSRKARSNHPGYRLCRLFGGILFMR